MITVLGASGFIGSHLVKRLEELDIPFDAPRRDKKISTGNAGDVIYCIGLTSDFRSRPFDTVRAHVCKLLEVLQGWEFDSLLYLSSTRLYRTDMPEATEGDSFQFNSLNPSDLYNISKAMGESLSLACGKKTRVVRLSNVYGDDFTSENFLPSIIKDAVSKKKVILQTSADSTKDYVNIRDVVDGLINIATKGEHTIYNLASGVNVSNQQLMERISQLTDCRVEFERETPTINFPPINIDRMRTEFDFRPSNVLADITTLVDTYRDSGGLGDQN
jgi:nucleoside-diphosphate-sugar epimerase